MRTPQFYPVFSLSEATAAPAIVPVGDDDTGEERAWIAGIRAGHEAAFEAMFRRYFLPLHDYLLIYVKTSDAAKEGAQDVLLALWERRTRIDIRESLRHYLYQAARNHALNWARRHRTSGRWEEKTSPDLSISGPILQPAADPERHTRALSDVIVAALDRLPARRREALVLRVQHHLSNAGIAKVMGISVKMVEIHVTYALKALRDSIEYHLA